MISKEKINEQVSFRKPNNFPACDNCPIIKNIIDFDIKQLTEDKKFEDYVKAQVFIYCKIDEPDNPSNSHGTVTISQGGFIYPDPRIGTTFRMTSQNNVKCPVLNANRDLTKQE